ncbi:MAG: nickel ABC transporter substrate-binding protein [Desulfovibrio sp.]|uniref:nickel ABC transporter substrate-binding protein n=1 Tax=Desulfovibrio sp. TaxID=885 RepID=UPI0039E690F0
MSKSRVTFQSSGRCVCCYFLTVFLALYAFSPALAANSWGKDTLVYAWSSNVGPLNPHAYGANKMFAQALVYEPLVQYGEGGKITPWLAESWQISSDGKVYTFKLRDDVLFSDGTPFTADAVVKNFDAVRKNIKRHDWLATADMIDSYRALDARTFELTLKQPYAAALQELTLVRPLRFLSPAAMPQDGNTGEGIKAPIGTGPWILAESRKGEFDRFVRNDNYWGEKPRMRQLVIKVIPDAETRAVALETGEVDLIATAIADHGSAGVNPDAYAALSKDPAYSSSQSAPRNTRLLAMNTALFPTNELAVRQAIVRGIDRPSILKGVLLDQEAPAEELLAKDIPFCDVALKPYPHSLDEAAAILDKAGWKLNPGDKYRTRDGKTLRLELKFIANENIMRSIAEVVQSNLARIGMDVQLMGEEPNAFGASQTDGGFNMIFCESNGAPYDPFSYVAAMRVAGHADFQAQRGLPQKKELDAAITRALATTDAKELQTLFTTILTMLHDEAVYVPVSRTIDKALFKKKNIQDFSFSPVSYELPLGRVARP